MAWYVVVFAVANVAVGMGAAVYLGFLPLEGLRVRAKLLWRGRCAWGRAVRERLWARREFVHGVSWFLSRWADEAIILAQRGWALLGRRRDAESEGEGEESLAISRLLEPFDSLRETLASIDGQLAESTAGASPENLLSCRETIEAAHQRWIEATKNAAVQLQEAAAKSAVPDEIARKLQCAIQAIQEHLDAFEALLVDLVELDISKPLRARAILRGSVVSALELSQDLVDCLVGTLAAYDQAQGTAALPLTEQQDPLTNLPNLRGLEGWLQPRRARSAASHALAGVLVYVDGLEAVNRRWGVHVGDRVLIEVARLVRKSVRPPRFAARICGPQFLLLLPTRKLASAQRVAEQLRRKVENLQLAGMQEPPRITATCLAALCDAAEPADAMVRQLHRALFERGEKEPNQTWVLQDGIMRLVSSAGAALASQACGTP